MTTFIDQPTPDVNQDTRPCLNCHGTGKIGKLTCMQCKGTGVFDRPDIHTIYRLIKGRDRIRQKPPSNNRAFYVWRMIKFHAGLDVKLPIEATARVLSDPWVDELEQAAEYLARVWYGTASAGVSRWGPLLGLIDPDHPIPNQPDTAYVGGPTAMDIPDDSIQHN